MKIPLVIINCFIFGISVVFGKFLNPVELTFKISTFFGNDGGLVVLNAPSLISLFLIII